MLPLKRSIPAIALARCDDVSGMRHAMEQVSTWLGQAVAEGRAAVNAHRWSTTETNDLAEALRRAIEDCREALASIGQVKSLILDFRG